MKDFKKLKVWEKGIALSVKVYDLVNSLPEHERYGLSSLITRCAVSIPANIAEGSSRESIKEYKRYLEIALGSAFELETFLTIILKLNRFQESSLDEVISLNREEQKMLSGLIRRLKSEL
jgi:four helix bundle protein